MGRLTTRVLVTGGAGFLGGHLVKALVDSGARVRVLDDLSHGSSERLTRLGAELLHADVRNPLAVRRALEDMEVVYHLAGTRAVGRDLRHAEEVNVLGALNLLEGARATRPRRVVFAGSGEVYGRATAYLLHEEVTPIPVTALGVQNLAVENYARIYHTAHHVPSVVLRIFRTFGPAEPWDGPDLSLVPRLCRAAIAGAQPVIDGEPRHALDLVYVDNVIAAILAAGSIEEQEGGVFNIASGESTPLGYLWSLLCDLAGRRRETIEPSWSPTTFMPGHARVSIARACRCLGYSPAVRLREGMRRTLETYLDGWRADPHAWFRPPESPSLASAATQPTHAAMSVLASGPKRRPTPPPPPPRAALVRPVPAPSPERDVVVEMEDIIDDDGPPEFTWVPSRLPGGQK